MIPDIAGDDALTFEENSMHPAQMYTSGSSDDDSIDTEDPLTRGQSTASRVDMFRAHLPRSRPRFVRGGNRGPVPIVPALTPGAYRIP